MTPPAVFRSETQTYQWYWSRLFKKQAPPTILAAEKSVIRTLAWKPPAKFLATACNLCCLRPIDHITLPKGDTYLLERLGLTHLSQVKNRQLAQLLKEFP
jgi:hypothetical protein